MAPQIAMKNPYPGGSDHEKRRITSDTALRMSRFFGTSAEFWMNLQQAYDLKITRDA
jgi:antitoxin HigA-1